MAIRHNKHPRAAEPKTRWLTAAVGGLLLTAAFPKPEFSLLAWVALVPFFSALRDAAPRQAFRTGWIFGLAHYLTLLYWVILTMRNYGYLPWWQAIPLLFLLAAYLGLYPALFAVLVRRFCTRPAKLVLLAPVFWVALEYARSFLLTGFPWGLVGYSQYNRLHIIQISDMFGVYGVSFLVVLCCASAAVLLLTFMGWPWQGRMAHRKDLWVAMSLPTVFIALALMYGGMRLHSVDKAMAAADTAQVALVQGNIDQAHKWDPAFQIGSTKKYVDMTMAAAAKKPDLIVWPETATPFYFEASPKLTGLVVAAVKKSGAHLLLGSPSFEVADGKRHFHNSAYMVGPDGLVAGRYDKVHLVPFGEYVPLKRLLFFAGKMVAQVGDFSKGEKGRTLDWRESGPPIGVQICFEIVFPGLSRALVKNGAGLLANLTNDAWFDRSGAAYQHFAMTVFRAVENRRVLVRAANTGISGFVDPAGRVLQRTALFEDAVVQAELPMLTQLSLYTRMGDVLPLFCLLFVVFLIGRRVLMKSEKETM